MQAQCIAYIEGLNSGLIPILLFDEVGENHEARSDDYGELSEQVI